MNSLFLKLASKEKDIHDEFYDFILNLEHVLREITLRNRLVVLIYARNFIWLTTAEVTPKDPINTFHGHSQIISDPIHIPLIFSFGFYLFLTNQRNLVIKAWVHPFTHPNYHHETASMKCNLKIE